MAHIDVAKVGSASSQTANLSRKALEIRSSAWTDAPRMVGVGHALFWSATWRGCEERSWFGAPLSFCACCAPDSSCVGFFEPLLARVSLSPLDAMRHLLRTSQTLTPEPQTQEFTE